VLRPESAPISLALVTVERDLAPGEWSILALLAEQPGHGWALARQMARDGEIGSVWSLGRPLVYRALELLEERGLIEAVGLEPGLRGPNRTIFRATDRGRSELEHWLAHPVDHVREIRSLFLLKLILIERAELDPRPLLEAQREQVEPAVETLEARLVESTDTSQILIRFRLESTRAVLHFIDNLLARREAR
jgi:DNA-binding PadR family transcriptional regulator